jgi:hypothetical protein
MAQVDPAWEASMDVPTQGTLCLSAGLHLEHCSPAFVWSADSRFLAVAQFAQTFWLGLRQHLLVIDVAKRQVYRSAGMGLYLQPETFSEGRLTVIRQRRRPVTLSWQIPDELSTRFTRHFPFWADNKPEAPRP